MLTNYTNTVLYIGITNNLERRIEEHKLHILSSSFTSRYHLYKLVWYEEFSSAIEAIAAEKKLKGWIRKKKDTLIASINPTWKDLFTLH